MLLSRNQDKLDKVKEEIERRQAQAKVITKATDLAKLKDYSFMQSEDDIGMIINNAG